ncbi:MAG: hypothetical protein BWK73_09225 [Thiothrix lacustris]|uniref:DNA binding HTH domain-containing protein n=1 Tax=Thiothrix lacustris TaxID=525917 RepID=A0A1Y1QV73_9GAMM|nr:MAG: hypothetical protein BWK73_09225 [Thiothrix lacustris]
MPKKKPINLHPANTAPKTTMILAELGSEWLLPAMWSGQDQCWKVFVGRDTQEYSNPAFQAKLKGWLPVPDAENPIASIAEAVIGARIANQPRQLLTQAKYEVERGALVAAFTAHAGNRTATAATLDLALPTLSKKVSEHRIQKLMIRQRRSDRGLERGATHEWS